MVQINIAACFRLQLNLLQSYLPLPWPKGLKFSLNLFLWRHSLNLTFLSSAEISHKVVVLNLMWFFSCKASCHDSLLSAHHRQRRDRSIWRIQPLKPPLSSWLTFDFNSSLPLQPYNYLIPLTLKKSSNLSLEWVQRLSIPNRSRVWIQQILHEEICHLSYK